MTALTLPESRLRNLAKVCDIYDWFDPAFDHVVRQHLKLTPGPGRKTWEFAMVFLALHRHGALRGEAVGLGMAVGAERLLYALAAQVAHVRATDLFAPGARGARAEEPQAMIDRQAPWPLPNGRIVAERADMRALPYRDESFDFAWSVSAFGQLGEEQEILAHLDEVARVLKPGGLYAFTATVCYGAQTQRRTGDFHFTPDHLADLMQACDLVPEPVFDATISDHHANRPGFHAMGEFGCAGIDQQLQPVVLLRRGAIDTGALCLLRKAPEAAKSRAQVVGFQATHDRLWRIADQVLARFWADWQGIRLRPGAAGAVSTRHFFGNGQVELEVEAPGAPGCPIAIEIERRPPTGPGKADPPLRGQVGSGGVATFQAETGLLYSFALQRGDGGPVEALRLRARRVERQVERRRLAALEQGEGGGR